MGLEGFWVEIDFCEIGFFGDLSSSRLFVFWELQEILIQQFGDLTCRNKGWFRSSVRSIDCEGPGVMDQRPSARLLSPLQRRLDFSLLAASFPLTTNL